MAITRNGRDPRLEFIFGILEISLNLFGLSIEFDKTNKEYKLFYHITIENQKYMFYITKDIKKILDFCNIKTLYNKQDYFDDRVLFNLLLRNKYYNQNLIEKLGSYRDIKRKFDLKETSKLFIDFNKYVRGMRVDNYIFTNYDSIYVKSIDNFFGSKLEEEITKILKDSVEHKYNEGLVTQILAYYNGYEPPSKDVRKFMKDYKESIEKFGDFYEFILNSSKEEVISDITNYLSELKLEEFNNSV